MRDDEFDPRTAVYEHLAATEELPVEREAGWRLGEAQALAADIATGDREADDHVAAARELASRLANRPRE